MNAFHADLIGTLSDLLTRVDYTMATAESCTGGMIAALCTDVAGSSDWFSGGVVAYANKVKQNLLGVPAEVLERHGAVSGEVVRHMAAGALCVCGAQAAVAVSGVAGPGGGTPEKPVGTVWIGLAVEERPGTCVFDRGTLYAAFPDALRVDGPERALVLAAERHLFSGDRAAVRRQTTDRALAGLVSLLECAFLKRGARPVPE